MGDYKDPYQKNSIMESKWLFFSWLNLFKKIVPWSTSETGFLIESAGSLLKFPGALIDLIGFPHTYYKSFEFQEETIFKDTCVLSTK